VPQRGVEERRRMPGEVVHEPDGQRDGRVRRDAPHPPRCESVRHRSGDPEHGEEWGPLGEDHVLEQMRREQVVEPQVVQRRPEGDREQAQGTGVTPDPPPRRGEAADGEEVQQHEDGDHDGRVHVRLPGVRRMGMRDQHRGYASGRARV